MNLTKLARLAIFSLIFTCSSGSGYAVRAYPGIITHTNPDGTTLEIQRHGDERFNFTTTADGMLIKKDADGFFRYAVVNDGQTMATEFIASNADHRTADASMMLAGLDQQAMVNGLRQAAADNFANPAFNGPTRSASNGTLEKSNTFPTIGSPRILVILVDFPDYGFSFSKQQFKDWLSKEGYNYNNGTGRSSGSVLDYYKASSNGKFTPQFDIVGPVTANRERAYYGHAQSPSSQRAAGLAKEACQKAHDNLGVRFDDYDNNNDGEVDIVYMVYAGPGSADSDDDDAIWPHKWTVYMDGTYKYLTLDNKRINTYGCSAELSSGRYFSAIGTFSHEFAHCLGLQDHYDTDYCGNRDPDHWDIMASGSYNNNGNTPPLMSAYERHVLGWLKPSQLSKRGNYTLRATATDGYEDAFIIPTTKANEYFVLENRQQSGWDAHLPHHGMLIWHIDYNSSIWSQNKVNCKEHQYVDIEEAGGTSNKNETATPFPGSTDNRSFTDDTTPSMRMWSGATLQSPITRITETPDGVISFKFKGGEPVPSNLQLQEPVTTHNQVTISWKPVNGVEEYFITVTEPSSGKILVDDVCVKATSYTISMLEPKTTYEYSVTYYENYTWPECVGTFTTTTTPLNNRRPENIQTTDVGDSYFTAEWDEMELADRYSMSVYTGVTGGSTTVTENFDNESLLPGWETTSSTFINTTGYYGSAAPALRLNTSDNVTSQIFDGNIIKIVLMHRRIGNTSATIQIFGRQSQNSGWDMLTTKTVATGKARTTVELDASQNIHQIMILQIADEASIMVDDIAITIDSSLELSPVDGLTGIDAGSKTSHTVRGLSPETTYYYTVRGHNTTHDSMESTPVEVTTDTFSGIDNVTTDGGNSVTTDGLIATVTTSADAIVCIYTPAGVGVTAPVKLQSGTSAAFQLPAKGIYIVKVGAATYKIVAD